MNNPIYLKQQYQKISKKLHKAFTTGRFYQYTQYKQQRLLDKFSNYSLQLRKLGIAVAIGAGVSMAAPVQGQVPFAHRTGLDNPIDTFKSDVNTFVDIDGDGDLDVVGTETFKRYGNNNYFYENIGTTTSPDFIERSSVFTDSILHWVKFADIDGDGDLDCFASTAAYDLNTYSYTGEGLKYYENIGNSSNYNFIERPGTQNPLDSINIHSNRWGQSSIVFGDIDDDGDLDAYYHTSSLSLYYENIGTSATPVFLKNDNSNPFSGYTSNSIVYGGGLFYDQDRDGDLDFISPSNTDFFRNIGSTTNPNFVLIQHSNSPYSQIDNDSVETTIQLVDIDGDGDLDIFGTNDINYNGRNKVYYENIALPYSIDKKNTGIELDLTVFPNPTTGIIQLEQPLTGTLEVFNTLGQVLHTEQLEEQQQINLGHLNSGNYILKIQTEEGILNIRGVNRKVNLLD